MSKFTNLNNLDKLSKALDKRCKELIDEEKARALAEEQALKTEINITKEMFGGKSIKYVTQDEYDNLSEAEKNSGTVTYFITDAVDLSHEHENKEFLDNLAARNISIGNKSQVFDGVNDLHYSISDIGAAPAVHNHDDRYYTETEINTKISEINDNIDGHVADLNAAIDGKADTGHNHDDRYFTETEVTNKLAGKADTGHTHDDIYYTETEIDGKISTLNNAINGKAPSTHTHDDRYYTETEINGKIEDINETINSKEAALQSRISELEAALNPEVHEINVSGGVLTLTNKKYQKCNNIVDGTEIVFPSVSKFTEIHLYFDADSNMNLAFPDCKWRVELNIEEGGTYEVIATYNTVHWLVTIITYS